MKSLDPLIRASLIRRYKRFLSDHRLEDGSIVIAHCTMLGLTEPGVEGLCYACQLSKQEITLNRPPTINS